MRTLSTVQDVLLGCDPEFFFSMGGKIIGSERVIPEDGIHEVQGHGKIIRDGVQAEINVKAYTCRAQLYGAMRDTFLTLSNYLTKYPDVSIDFSQVVKVSQKEMSSLGEKSTTFGCAESKNAHLKTLDKISKIGVDPKKYLKRSAGGHIHLGIPQRRAVNDVEKGLIERPHPSLPNTTYKTYDIKIITFDKAKNPDILVPLLDILVGNTCVLLDRDEGNIERRKVYGRAGEYRTPAHGIEYRTLSNFWLRHPVLMSLVMSLARTAVQMVVESTETNDYVTKMMSLVDMADIEKAINTNDYDLAYANFRKIEKFLMSIVDGSGWFALDTNNIKAFHYFVERGLDHWFTDSPLNYWTRNDARVGFNDYLRMVVEPKMK
jgi:hypothetical protein